MAWKTAVNRTHILGGLGLTFAEASREVSAAKSDLEAAKAELAAARLELNSLQTSGGGTQAAMDGFFGATLAQAQARVASAEEWVARAQVRYDNAVKAKSGTVLKNVKARQGVVNSKGDDVIETSTATIMPAPTIVPVVKSSPIGDFANIIKWVVVGGIGITALVMAKKFFIKKRA